MMGRCLPYRVKAELLPEPPAQPTDEADKARFEAEQALYQEQLAYARRVIPVEIEKMKVLSEITDLVSFFFKDIQYPADYDEKGLRKWSGAAHLRGLLEKEIAAFERLPAWTRELLEQA